MEVFKEQMSIISDSNYKFYNPELFVDEFKKVKNKKQILITIDDAFKSFYTEAWPYLKRK